MFKRGRGLKVLRVAVSAMVFLALTAAFSGFFLPAAYLSRAEMFPAVLSFFSNFGLWLAGVFLLFHLLSNLMWGRLYCSFGCPLGFLQDIAGRLGRICRLPRFYRPQPNFRWFRRFFFLFILALIVGGGMIQAGWVDPYSLFGRAAAESVAHLVRNLTGGEYDAARPFSFPRGIAVFSLLGVILLAAFRSGRIFCNTCCPVGAGLGILARHAIRPLGIADHCIHCGKCVKTCKAGCIDLKNKTIDPERCVQCFNCQRVCPVGAVERQNISPPAPEMPESGRRNFLMLAAAGSVAAGFSLGRGVCRIPKFPAGSKIPVMPPGAMSLSAFASKCTGCGLCIANCPGKTLEAAVTEYSWSGFGRPFLSTAHGFCDYSCHRCATVCPTGALREMPLAEKRQWRIGTVSYFRSRCIVVTDHTDCGACAEHCPTGALEMVPFGDDGLTIPQVHEELCIGCGGCEYICPVRPVRAILVNGVEYQSPAASERKKSASRPLPSGGDSGAKAEKTKKNTDFPF